MTSPVEVLLRDPLTDVTRKERKFLLGVCAIAITIVKTGLVPTKIYALGVDFSPADQKSILVILSIIVAYFLAAFLIYAVSDFVAWRVAFHGAVRELMKSQLEEKNDPSIHERSDAIRQEMERYTGRTYMWGNLSRPVSLLRAFLDFVVPFLFGIITILLLLLTDVSKGGS